jgi:hypothetical protein
MFEVSGSKFKEAVNKAVSEFVDVEPNGGCLTGCWTYRTSKKARGIKGRKTFLGPGSTKFRWHVILTAQRFTSEPFV